jgi:hypothetical protein
MRTATKAARRRKKQPANGLAYGLVEFIGKQKRRISTRLLVSFRLPGKRRYEVIVLKEGPKEPTETFFWPRELNRWTTLSDRGSLRSRGKGMDDRLGWRR